MRVMKNVLKRVGVFTLAVALVMGVVPMPHVTEVAKADGEVIHTGFTATNGTGEKSAENYAGGYDGLVDGLFNNSTHGMTKWCIENFTGAYIEFNSNAPITPTGYILTTGDDTRNYPGRNPTGWTIKAKNATGDEWTTLATVTNDTTLRDVNCADYRFGLNNSAAYQYFRLEINNIKSGNIFQLEEFRFISGVDLYHDLSKGTLTGSTFYKHTGSTITPVYTVKASDGSVLTEGTDYTASITKGGNSVTEIKDEGDYVLTVTGSGPFTGGLTLNINVDKVGKPVTTGTTVLDGETCGFYSVKQNVTINSRIEVSGKVVLVLGAGATLNASKGIHVPEGAELTISGTGALVSDGNGNWEKNKAGIGGDGGQSCGTVTITGGTVTATGGEMSGGAGIGGGAGGSGGTVHITGGTVTATGGGDAAGIGAGCECSNHGRLTVGNRVTVLGGNSANPETVIGDFSTNRPRYMIVKRGTDDLTNAGISGIKSYYMYTGNVIPLDYAVTYGEELTEGTHFTATLTKDGVSAASVREKGVYTLTLTAIDGSGYTGTKAISFTVGDAISVTAETAEMLDGVIYKASGNVTVSGRISVSGTAELILDEGATLNVPKGIHVPAGRALTISGTGALVINDVDGDCAGIGGDCEQSCGTVTITGGTVTATGGVGGAGIGGGKGGAGGIVTISGGMVTATGGNSYAAGIGRGDENDGDGSLTISTGYPARGSTDGLTDWTTVSEPGRYQYYKVKPTLTITYMPNGGIGESSTQMVFKGESKTLAPNGFSRTGYKFKEWNTLATPSESSTGVVYAANASVTLSEDLTLYAQWVEKDSISPVVSITSWTYGDAANSPSVTGNIGNGTVTYEYFTDASCTTKTTTANSGAESNGGVPKKAGNYYVKATVAATDNYKSGTGTAGFTISRKSVTVTGLTATNRNYNPDSRTVILSGGTVSDVVNGDNVTVDLSSATGTMTDADAGTGKPVIVTGVKLGGTAAGNYILSAQPTGVTVNINKIAWTAKTASGSAKYGQSGTVDLSALIAEGGTIGTITKSDSDSVLDGDPTISDGKLSFTFVNEASKVDKQATVTFPVTGATNYDDYNITVTLTVSALEVPTLTVNDFTKTYDGNPVSISQITKSAKVGEIDIPGTWEFKDDPARTDVVDSGVKTVVFTPTDATSYAGGEATLTLTINRKAVIVKADNKIKTVGTADPTLTATVSGLVGNDTVTYVLSRVEGETAGSYTITPAGDAIQGNYSVSYQTGTLTINASTGGGGSNPGIGGGGTGGSGGGSNPSPTTAPVPTTAPTTEPTTAPDKTPMPPAPTVDDTVKPVVAPSAAPVGETTTTTETGKDGTETETKTTTYTDGSTMTEEKITKPDGTVTEKTEVVSPDGAKASSEVTVEPNGTKIEKVETVSADGKEIISKEVVTETDGSKTIDEYTEKTEGKVKSTEEIVQTVSADGKVTETIQKTVEENLETGKKTEIETVWDETGEVATTKTVETEKVGKKTVVDTVIENKDGSSLVSNVVTTDKGKETSRILETSATGNTVLTEQVKQPSGDYSKVTLNTTLKKDENGNVTGATVTLDTEVKSGNITQKSSFVLLNAGAGLKKTSLNSLIKKAAKAKNAVALKKATTTKKNGTITIEKTVKADGKTYTVTSLKKGLLKKNKTKPKKVTIKASGITKVEKGAFNNLAKKATIKVKAGKKDFNRIKKLITKSGLPKGVKVKRV